MNKFGDKKVFNICESIKSGRYNSPEKLLWQYTQEDRLTPKQFEIIMNAIAEERAAKISAKNVTEFFNNRRQVTAV